ncbi:uncharacterized protein [Dermacentor andersoni]|uniref:uncharacterized protein isoform X1 n=2 Tax=Dermacentor andersoni TaxID=34620 RepID=UPI002155B408|nr:uncharacterized protein LOC126524485 isoform X1 [Dermacentor andersoni]
MGPCPGRGVGGAPISSIIVPLEVEAGPDLDLLIENLVEDAAGGQQEAPVNPPAVPPNPPDILVNPPGAPPNPPEVPANLPETPRINKTATALLHQLKECRAIKYGLVCGTICALFSVTVYGILGPRASPTMLLMQPWIPWIKRPHDTLVPRIMVWTGAPSESSAAPPVVNAASVLAAPEPSSYNEKWITCSFVGYSGDDMLAQRRCTVTYDRRLVMESDAIVFPADSVNVHDLPGRRAIRQLWVLWARTAPALDVSGVAPFNLFRPWKSRSSISDELLALFNWTMSSRQGAHVNSTYKSFRPRSPSVEHPCSTAASRRQQPPGNRNSSEKSTMLRRRADAAWIAADCEQRVFEEEIRTWSASKDQINGCVAKVVNLHVIPNCGVGLCESMADCVAYVARHFNFIVVTQTPACFPSLYELVYEAFKHDLVPVVLLSSPNVPLNLPPKSTVSVQEILEPMFLEEYIRYLLDHPAAYEAYFDWKQKFTVTTLEEDLCPLCVAQHGIYKWKFPAGQDVREWWHLRATCSSGPLFR